MARHYANENFPVETVEALQTLGHDVLTSQLAGNAGRGVPDEDVLQYAVTNERVVITMNRVHFHRLHRSTPDHFGIITCTFDLNYAGLASRIHEAIVENEPLIGKLVRVIRPNPSSKQAS